MGRRFAGALKARAGTIVNVSLWHKDDLRLAASEGPLKSGLPTLGAECLVSGGKPTVFYRALKVA